MLQRIQTVYLIIAILLAGVAAFMVPFWQDANNELVYLNSMLQTEDIPLLAVPILFMVSALMTFLTIISFKNRTKQIIYNRLNIVINFFLLGIVVYHQLKLPGETFVSEKGIGVFIPLLMIVFLALANKAIIKDDKLVKSVDRLR
ncbi:MAG: DUF4293 domain-containing protein [Flavobacteriales bacterium]|nr:DUF4293 domain-containing protein [Flavobacteriales bacterium]